VLATRSAFLRLILSDHDAECLRMSV
jgi:hypothetical protein